jgi:hypothetical protein
MNSLLSTFLPACLPVLSFHHPSFHHPSFLPPPFLPSFLQELEALKEAHETDRAALAQSLADAAAKVVSLEGEIDTAQASAKVFCTAISLPTAHFILK